MQYKFEGGLFSPQFWQIIIFFILQSFYFVDTNLPNGLCFTCAAKRSGAASGASAC
jgi:hypothetical protein